MVWTVIFKPVIPIPILLGVGTVGLAAILGGYAWGARGTGNLRKLSLALLRTAALAVMLLILARPMVLQPEDTVSDRPSFSVLVDASESMNTKDAQGQSRYRAAVAGLFDQRGNSLIPEFFQRFRVKLYSFDKEARSTSPAELASRQRTEGKATHIAAALMDVVQEGAEQPQGVLLISDGRSNEIDSRASVNSAARHLRTMKIPVWTAPVGLATEVKDVYVVTKLNSSYLLADQPGSIHASVTGAGYADWNVKLNLYREDRYLTSTQVNLRGGHGEISFPIREPRKGVFQYRVEVEALPGETDTKNNERCVVARVVDEKVKVLVVEATPHWDSKFLLRALRADMNIEVTSIFHINRNKTFAVVEKISENNALSKTLTPGVRMPKTRAELDRYDCIFLGKAIDDVFSSKDLGLLRDYVARRGGSLVFFRGKPYTTGSPALAGLEPVTWGQGRLTDARFELTAPGKSNPMFDYKPHERQGDVIVRELPAMTSITRVDDQKSLAVILARTRDSAYGSQMATVAYHRYGKGKVMTIAASGLWQWGFLPEPLQEYDDIHARFWGQMIRWLISDSEFLPGRDISFVADRHTYSPGDTVRLALSARLVDQARYRPWVELTDPAGETTRLVPRLQAGSDNLYAAHFNPEKQGQYKAVLHNNIGQPQSDMLRFTVYDDSLEARYVHADRDLLQQLADTTGAESLELAQLQTLPQKVKAFARLSRERTKPQDIWDRRWVFGVLIGLLGGEWLLRRISGLV